MLMGRADKQQHHKGADVSGDCSSYGGSVEPICNVNLDDRRELNTLHVLDDLTAPNNRKAEARKPRLSCLCPLLFKLLLQRFCRICCKQT